MFLIKMLKKEIKNAKIKLFFIWSGFEEARFEQANIYRIFFFFTYLLGTVLTNQQ